MNTEEQTKVRDQNRFKAEIWDGNKEGERWEDIKGRIMFLENEEFKEKSFTEEMFEKHFKNLETVVVLLKGSGSEIIGFTYVQPIGEACSERASENKETVLIWDTVIGKNWRGRHLVGKMMDCMEEELRKRGYKYMEREARIENNYAANVAQHYAERIVEQSGPHDSPWGPQMFFRIKL